jgi:protein gp37
MSTATSIEWTETTWNPTTGCDRISPGCDRCYALTLAARLKAMGQAKYQADGDPRTSGPGFGVALHPDALVEPLGWRKPRKVFVDSMADVLHARVPTDFVAQVWAVMALTPQHVYQVLTKRPERYAKVLDGPCGCGGGHRPGIHFHSLVQDHTRRLRPGGEVDLMASWPLPNVWLGTSIENDDYVARADALRAAPAAVRCVDCTTRPLLFPLNFREQSSATEESCRQRGYGTSRSWWCPGLVGSCSGRVRSRAGSCRTRSRSRWLPCSSI